MDRSQLIANPLGWPGWLAAGLWLVLGAAVQANTGAGTPLHRAAEAGNEEEVTRLLAAGADVNSLDLSDTTPLHRAVEAGHEVVVERLLAAGAKVNVYPSKWSSRPPLALAAGEGHLAIVERLLAAGAEVNFQDAFGAGTGIAVLSATPLHEAAASGHLAVVERLLAAGADVRLSSSNGTPLESAKEAGHTAIVKRLLAEPAIVSELLLRAAANGDQTAVARWLADNNTNVNFQIIGVGTALHRAAEEGHLAVVEQLLAAGAEVNAWAAISGGEGYGAGWTPLHGAAVKGHLAVVERLLAAGAEVNTVASSAWTARISGTALHQAAAQGHVAIVERLLTAGTDAHLEDGGGRTALKVAIDSNLSAIVTLLQAAGGERSL